MDSFLTYSKETQLQIIKFNEDLAKKEWTHILKCDEETYKESRKDYKLYAMKCRKMLNEY